MINLSIPFPRIRVRGVRIMVTVGLVFGLLVFPILAVTAPNRPTPSKIAVVIDDDAGWQSIITEVLRVSGFTVQSCVTFCDNPAASLFIVDAQDAAEIVVGPSFVRNLRLAHPQAVIIGISSNLDFIQVGVADPVAQQFILAGATAVWDKAGSIKLLRSLLP